MEIEKKTRIIYMDALKGFAIFCVLWGHSLQHLKNNYDFFHNPIVEVIYSFHMPLFFMVSGFFFNSSLRLNLKEFSYKKSIQLLLPCIVWAIIYYILKASISIANGNFYDIWYIELEQIIYPSNWIWFLKELFISSFLTYVSIKLFKKEWLAFLVSISFVMIWEFGEIQRVFLPMFWAGIYLKANYQFVLKYAKQILVTSGALFIICLLFWDGYYTKYVTPFPNLFNLDTLSFNFTNMDISVFRLFIALCGSLFCFMVFERFYKKNKYNQYLEKIGINTLAIYLLQRLILEIFIKKVFNFAGMNIWIYTLIVTPLVSLIVLVICMKLIKLIEKNRYLKLLLLGKQSI